MIESYLSLDEPFYQVAVTANQRWTSVMKWFKGDVLAAAREARRRNVLMLVFLTDSEASSQMNETFEDKDTTVSCDNNCVSIRLERESQLANQFCQIYQLKGVPSTFLIGRTGKPLEIIEGQINPEQFINRLKSAVKANGSTFTLPQQKKSQKAKSAPPVKKSAEPEAMEIDEKEGTSASPRAAAATKCRIQFRLPDGSNTSDAFPTESSLGDVWEQIAKKLALRRREFNLVMSHPRRSFDENDMDKNLVELGLVPSAVILVIPNAMSGVDGSDGIVGKLISSIFGLFLHMWNSIIGLFGFGNSQIAGPPATQPASAQAGPSSQERWQTKRSRQGESNEIRKKREGNMTRLSALRNDDSDDDATWNGNSTQQL